MNNNISQQTPFERRGTLLTYLKQRGTASVRELAETFYLHEATVRRDLNELADSGLLRRVRGGASVIAESEEEIPLFVRETGYRAEKQHIARKAADLVRDGEMLFIDSSSTAAMMVQNLEKRRGLRIVTDGIRTAGLLGGLRDAEIFCVGGRLRGRSYSLAGSIAIADLERFHFDSAFFSCRGVDLTSGLTDISEEEAIFRRVLISRCKRSVLLADHSKIGHISFYSIAPVGAIDTLVTDAKLSEEWSVSGPKII